MYINIKKHLIGKIRIIQFNLFLISSSDFKNFNYDIYLLFLLEFFFSLIDFSSYIF